MPKKAEADSESSDFKERISPSAIAGLARIFEIAWPDFPRLRFEKRANRGLTGLEMKGRVVHVADALADSLPDDFPEAATVIGKALDLPQLDGWIVYCIDDYVARYGIYQPEVALPLMARLTPRWTCEYAIRPFIETHPEITFEYFDEWIESENEHLRRLVSEGSRPRLPWGGYLKGFVADPTPTISLLDRLVDDPSPYVRKSVANHLNDITKDHPDLAIGTAQRWLDEGGEAERRAWIVNHGMRSLIKKGDPAALALAGYDHGAEVAITRFRVSPGEIAIGESVAIEFALTAPEPTPVMVDYAIHHAGSSGMRSAKVFKLKRLELEPGVETAFVREHRIREVSVRRIHPGPHLIEIQVNGRILAAATVEVQN
ncbi:MAG: DNA alkylation repair protein [Solirubrobacterales bacterium]|nr:DNA alkylation repair protein [Solirubrobacterales bacterium]